MKLSSKVPLNDFLQNGLNRRNIIEPTAAKNEGRTNVVPKAEKLVDINNTAPTAHENDRAEKVVPEADFLIRQFPFGMFSNNKNKSHSPSNKDVPNKR